MNYRKTLCISFSVLLFAACTKLNEKIQGEATQDQIGGNGGSTDALLKGAYNSMRIPYQNNDQVFALSEMSTDEQIAPTRGGDWDDNGVWRVLHEHKWDGDNIHIRDAFNNLGGVIYTATNILQFNPSAQQAAEARFLRAFAMFNVLDFFNQVPYREPGEKVTVAAKVRTGTEALDYIINEVNTVMKDLPDAPVTKATKDAARVLLMKCYLNRGVIANRAAPTFDAGDMTHVIALADSITNGGRFGFSANYFDNFAPNNGTLSKENIFTAENQGGVDAGGLNALWHTVMHYNQSPPGWNGWATLSDFYNKFEASDKRRGVAYATNGPANPGKRVNVGFLAGQQYDLTTDKPLTDRTGAPLIFTPEVHSIETGNNLEVTGIRVVKYVPDYVNDGNGKVDNDFVYYRYPDVLLMKAEAILRGGTGSAIPALVLVNQIRLNRGASPLASVTLDNLLDERGRELYWECSRRLDLIRFGKFLTPWQEKPSDDPKYLLFPIPNQQLAVNPNLKKNPGY